MVERQRYRIATIALAMGMWSLPATAQNDVESCRVLGRVIDAELGGPISGANVWLESGGGLDFRGGTTTSPDGSFSIDVRSCGVVELRTRMIGYTEGFALLEFDTAGQAYQVTVRLERAPLELEELQVEVPASLRLQGAGFYARKAWVESTGRDYADFYDPEEVVGRSAAYHTVGEMAAAARIRWMYPPHSLCRRPSFYVDGLRFDRPFDFGGWLDHAAKLGDIEGVEIYRAVWGAIPDEFREPNSSTCGLVLIWTKQGGRGEAPQIEVELCEPTRGTNGLNFGGVITDQFTGVRLPAAYVTLITTRDGARGEALSTISDADGRYRYCDVAVVPVSVRARYGEAYSASQRVDESAMALDALDLEVPVTPPGEITGRLIADGVVPDGTLLALDGTNMTATPDTLGVFRFQDVPPGDYILTVTNGGQIVLRRKITVQSDVIEELELKIES